MLHTSMLLLAALLDTPDTVLLVPERFDLPAGAALVLHAERLDATGHATRTAWPPSVSALFWRAGDLQENRDTLRPEPPNSDAVTIPFAGSDVVMVGMTLPARDAIAPGAELRALLPPDSPLAGAIEGQVAVRDVRTCKTLVRVGAATPSVIALSKTTQPVELRPLIDPTHARIGSDVAFRLYVNGTAIPRARVVAVQRESGARADLVTDPIGACHFTITRAGEWLVVGYAVTREDSDAPGRWRRSIATLTFATPTAGGGR